jgi:signal transduction histidine kinase
VVVELSSPTPWALVRVNHGGVTPEELEAAHAAREHGRLVSSPAEPSGPLVAAPAGDGLALVCRLRGLATASRLQRIESLAETMSLAVANERLLLERRRLVAERLVTEQRAAANVAYDLHDGAAQKLLWSRNALALLATDPERAPADAEALDDLRSVVAAALEDVQQVMARLNATADADARSLAELLGEEAELLTRRTGVAVALELSELPSTLDPTVTLASYRLAQEAMTNAVRHAAPTRLRVSATVRDGRLSLVIEDDGDGFDTAAVLARPAARASGLGLRGMRERVALLGGRIAIESTPGVGSRVSAELPTTTNDLV